MSRYESQKTIAAWGRETFGETHPLVVAARMQVEVAELLELLAQRSGSSNVVRVVESLRLSSEALSELVLKHQAEGLLSSVGAAEPGFRAAVEEECADVNIMLLQVAEAIGGHLDPAVDSKMAINRRRTWSRLPSGRHQHDG